MASTHDRTGMIAQLQRALADTASRIRTSAGWSRRGLAVLAGSLSVLAMAPFFAWPVLFLTLPVLVWMLDAPARSATLSQRLRSAFHDGWWFAFGYFFFGLFWIGEAFLVEAEKFALLLPFAITLMPAGLAVFWGLAAISCALLRTTGPQRILLFAVVFSVFEWLRGHIFTGFPWNTVGYALTMPIELMQAASLLGLYGLTLVAFVVFPWPLVVLADATGPARSSSASSSRPAAPSRFRPGSAMIALLPPLIGVASLYGFGLWRLDGPAPGKVPDVRLRIVQPSTPQRDKWLAEKQGAIFNAHLALSRTSPAGVPDEMNGVTHVVWPEAAMPFLPLSTPAALDRIAETFPPGTQLIAGALRVSDDLETPDRSGPQSASTAQPDIYRDDRLRRRVYNSLMVFKHTAMPAAIYDKLHLVPFGEYLPFQETLEAIGLEHLTRVRGGFSIGAAPRPALRIAGLPPVTPLICYEAIFPAWAIQTGPRPGLMINVTNDGWFGNTTGPHQHFHQARLRAVEQGIPLVRAANNGISAMIGPRGEVLGALHLNAIGSIDADLPRALPPTLYARFGDALFGGALTLLVALLLVLRFRFSPTAGSGAGANV